MKKLERIISVAIGLVIAQRLLNSLSLGIDKTELRKEKDKNFWLGFLMGVLWLLIIIGVWLF